MVLKNAQEREAERGREDEYAMKERNQAKKENILQLRMWKRNMRKVGRKGEKM